MKRRLRMAVYGLGIGLIVLGAGCIIVAPGLYIVDLLPAETKVIALALEGVFLILGGAATMYGGDAIGE